ncbi:hypothetical protein [Streptomyces sp.]|uniref:hypothetical protein n=1 Tax=Streptomyces sp. TaxID=1931 RepID=UPI002D414469|nr:hypothetical protein [Streptomyces sp.]HZF90423.1 hypothetical protein [Streptomyces sp.]
MDQQTLTEQTGIRYAAAGRRGKRVHYSPGNDDTLCGRAIEQYLDASEAVALLDKGHELCTPCHRAAEKRAEAQRLAAESPLAAAAVAFAETVEQVDAERAEAEQDVEQRYVVHELGDEYGVMDTYTVEWVIEQTEQSDAEATAARLNREHAEARAAGPIVHRFHSTGEAYNATQCRDHIRDGDVLVIEREQVVGFLVDAWPGAITTAHGELHTFTTDPRTLGNGKYAASVDLAEQLARELGAPLAAEQRVVEGVVVEHAGVTEGSTPSNSTHPDVVAARAALAQLKPAALTDHHDVTEPTEAEVEVRGFMLDPRGGGRVAAYWLEGGRIVRHDEPVNGTCLEILAMRFERAGWTVEPMLRSSQCVFAHRPAEAAAPAPQTTAAAVEPAPAAIEPAAPECLHRIAVRPDVSGDPITTCARKQPNQEAGVFSDEGCVEAFDCAVQAANRAAEMNVEEDAPAGDPLYLWDLLCVEHRDDEQQVDTCEKCNAVPAEDRCPECSGKGCHWCYWTGEKQPEQTEASVGEQGVDEPAAEVAGTWRAGWIKAEQAPAGDALFDLGDDVEQGQLFA